MQTASQVLGLTQVSVVEESLSLQSASFVQAGKQFEQKESHVSGILQISIVALLESSQSLSDLQAGLSHLLTLILKLSPLSHCVPFL